MRKVLQCGLFRAALVALTFHGTDSVEARPSRAEALVQSALQEAAAAGKPLLLEFGFPACKYCVRFDRAAGADPGIQTALSRAFVVRVDTTSRVGRTLAKQYSVAGVPQFVLLASNGEAADRFFGFLGLGQFARIATAALNDLRPLAEKRRGYQVDQVWSVAAALGRTALAEGRYGEAMTYLRRARTSAPPSEQTWLRVLLFWTVYHDSGFGKSRLPEITAAADDVFAITPEDVEARAIIASIMVGMSGVLPDEAVAERYARAAQANTGAGLTQYAEEALRDLAERMAETRLSTVPGGGSSR